MPHTVTRAMICEAAAERTGFSKTEVNTIAEAMLTHMSAALLAGENVKLTGFGSLQLRSRAARVGRDPRNGVTYPVSPRQTVSLVVGGRLRQALVEKLEQRG